MTELEQAKRLALFHDNIRRDVTEALLWALDTIDAHSASLPKNAWLARRYHGARIVLQTSLQLNECQAKTGA